MTIHPIVGLLFTCLVVYGIYRVFVDSSIKQEDYDEDYRMSDFTDYNEYLKHLIDKRTK